MNKKELRSKGRTLRPVMAIGKNGITQGAIQQLENDLEHKELVKVKFLRSFLQSKEREEAANELAAHTKAEIIDLTGNVVLLYKMRKDF